MRQITWEAVSAKSDGEFPKLPAGAYVAKITSAEDFAEREYVSLVYDIAEGPYAGFYSDKYGMEHPNAHRIIMSYKDTAISMLKGRLEKIQASNPGFDPFAAWDAGNLSWFVGRLVGINIREEEYVYNGEKRVRLTADQTLSAQDVRAGNWKPLARKELSDADKAKLAGGRPSAMTQEQIDYAKAVEVPFS